jgi:lysophospholipase L1-like esterase
MATQVIVVNVGCGIDGHDLTYHYTKQSIGSKNCSFIDLTSMTNSHSRTPYSSYVSFKDVRMSASGSMFTYWDDYKWSTIYAPNYLMPGQLYYLALGDSYASGEGDITSDGVNHYFSGTDVYGNYNQGIPRETCHLSTRSYSMRISSAMQLMKGTDMQSVACSGAVMSDILSLDRANDGYINSNYLGQSTQLISTVGARLTGVANATGLQTEARQDYTPGRIQQIELVKKAQPHYLTVMVGGNDLDFGGVLTACAENALPSTDETCDYATGSGFAGEIKKIHDLYPKLVEFYKALHEVSPKTIIYVIGYPQFMDENSDSCKQMLDLYSKPERKAIHQMIAYTNAVIKNAALDAGVKYIDISDALTGGQLCDTSTDMTGITDIFAVSVYTEYMKSLTMSDSKIAAYLNAAPSGLLRDIALQLYITERAAEVANKIAYSPATALADVMQELSHPNALGHEAIYKAIHDALGDDLLESTACNQRVACSDGTIHGQPDVNAYVTDFALDASNDTVYVGVDGKVRVGHKETSDSMMLGALVKRASDQFVRISAEDLPSTIDSTQPVTVEVHSQPIVLGNMDMVGGVYELQTSLDQNGIRAGMHVLHIKGRLTDGRAFDADASIFVEGPSGDIDDDGIADNIDTCAFGDTAGSDIDKDGVDDACDFDVSQQLSVHSHANTPSIDNNNLNRVTGVSTSGTDDATYNSEASLFMSHKKSIGDLAKRYVSTSVRAPISSMFIIVMTTVGLLLVLTGCYIVTARRRG